ncbi:MAG: hypothetical protein DRI57_16265, partial [Deltaproteobacteria bacterium]
MNTLKKCLIFIKFVCNKSICGSNIFGLGYKSDPDEAPKSDFFKKSDFSHEEEKMKKHVRYLFLLCTLILSLSYGCMAPPRVLIKDGKEYCKVDGHFTYRWYDYYERAVSCADGEFYDEAMSDLDKAIRQRDEDIRMAKVWGMRLRDYFPHREKGIIHYIQGQDEVAQSELQRSMRDEPSDKAEKWLDKVRKRLMSREPPSVPRIFVKGLSDENEIWTKDRPILLSGWAEDEQYVSEITISGQPYLVERSGKQVNFGKKLNLSQGEHRIRITATNLRGTRSAERELIIHVDRSGP